MDSIQLNQFEQLIEDQKELSHHWIEYWVTYSNIDTWQFWVNAIMLILPLVILYFFMDRKIAFHLGFFGYSHHVIALYFDGFATRNGLWEYPFKILPFLPNNIGLDSSLIPVVYILMYQWVLKHDKNYYLYALILSLLFSFGLKPIMAGLDLVKLENGTTYFHLFIAYIVGAVLAKWVTNIFIRAQR